MVQSRIKKQTENDANLTYLGCFDGNESLFDKSNEYNVLDGYVVNI